MTNNTFDIDGDNAAHEARKKAMAAKREADRIKVRNRLGDLVLAAGIANGRTPENLLGSWLWAKQQAHANLALNKEWDRLGATFLGKSTAAKASTGKGTGNAADTAPAPKGELGRRADGEAEDLLTRAAAE